MSVLRFRMATALADLAQGANFYILGIHEPDMAYFTDHTTRYPQSQGGQARQGYNQATLFWSELLVEEAAIIRGLIVAAEALTETGNGILYVTMPKNDGSSFSPGWIDISGVAIMPQWIPEQGTRGKVYSNITLSLNNVTVEAEPSTVVL